MITTTTLPAASGKGRLITLWTLSGLVALAFVFVGGGKLAGTAQMVELFDKVGLGQWFRYLTGSPGGGRRHRITDSAVRLLCGRPACHRHDWRNHHACSRSWRLPRL